MQMTPPLPVYCKTLHLWEMVILKILELLQTHPGDVYIFKKGFEN